VSARLGTLATDAAPASEVLADVDARIQEAADSQGFSALQRRSENEETAARGHDLIVLTVLPMALAGIIAALLLARSIAGSLNRMSALVRSIEAERQDVSITVTGEGEFSRLTRDIVSMRRAIDERSERAAAERARLEAERVGVLEERKTREAALAAQQRIERQTQRDRLAQDFEREVSGIVDVVAQTAQKLTATAESMSHSASQTSARSREASSVADQTSGTASQIAGGTQELSATAQAVRENAQQSRERAEKAVVEATTAKEQLDSLVAAARQIGSITEVIAGVARQTNLLAINARVEAARAGDAGRGFSIVANEVKELAKQTGDATVHIARQIEDVTSTAARSAESLDRLREVIGGLEGAVASIFSATDAQFASTRAIADRVSDISSSTASVAGNIRDAQATAGMTEDLAGEVARAAGIMDEKAAQLSEQLAGFVLELRSSGRAMTSPADVAIPLARTA
jgi:methyl-accepting chemotaxis protein